MAILQDFLDDQTNQIKKLANFDIDKEKQFYKLSVYEFLEHLIALHDEQPE